MKSSCIDRPTLLIFLSVKYLPGDHSQSTIIFLVKEEEISITSQFTHGIYVYFIDDHV